MSQLQEHIENLPSIGVGNIQLIMYSSKACADAGTSWTVIFNQNFGPLPLIVADASKLTFSDAISQPYIVVAHQIVGTKEDEPCSNRGLCDQTSGQCACSTNYDTSNGYGAPGIRADCGAPTTTILVCPGLVSCSGHGVCLGNPTYRCSCSDGWTGADCSDRLCPKDLSWFTHPSADDEAHMYESVECGDAGICDRSTGTCACATGFSGAACQYLDCPSSCSSQGQCLDMSTLAATAIVNGLPLVGNSYGETPNDPYTWDAKKIFGCLCSSGYTGYDCSLKMCPYGADPKAVLVYDEQQLLACTDVDLLGTLQLSFRQATTTMLSATSTSAQIKAALEEMQSAPGIYPAGTVQVAPKPGFADELCSSSGGGLVVTFLTEHGDVPLMTVTQTGLDTMEVEELIKGNKELLECSGRGLCDSSIGVCRCFPGYGSSDGQGGIGLLDDCGYTKISLA